MGLGGKAGFLSQLEQAALRSPGFPTRPARGPAPLLRRCRRRLCCWGGREEGPGRTLDRPSPWLCLYLSGLFSPSCADGRGAEGQSLGTPRHAADMPLFATNPFDQDVGKCFPRRPSVPRQAASPRHPPTAFLPPGLQGRGAHVLLSGAGRGLRTWLILLERNGAENLPSGPRHGTRGASKELLKGFGVEGCVGRSSR